MSIFLYEEVLNRGVLPGGGGAGLQGPGRRQPPADPPGPGQRGALRLRDPRPDPAPPNARIVPPAHSAGGRRVDRGAARPVHLLSVVGTLPAQPAGGVREVRRDLDRSQGRTGISLAALGADVSNDGPAKEVSAMAEEMRMPPMMRQMMEKMKGSMEGF